MPKPQQTHPFDVVVAMRLLKKPATLAVLGDELAASPSQVHAALRRLQAAGLIKPGTRATNPRALLDFLLAGLRYVFPVERGAIREGVPTAYSALPLSAVVDAVDVLVWPAPGHRLAVRGFSLTPLYPRAAQLAERSPDTYQLLTVADALRLGDPRLRPHARAALEAAIGTKAE